MIRLFAHIPARLLILPVLALLGACQNPVGGNGGHGRPVGVDLVVNGQVVASTPAPGQPTGWTETLNVQLNQPMTVTVNFRNAQGDVIPLGTAGSHSVRARPQGLPALGDAVRENQFVRLVSAGGTVEIHGRAAGETQIVFDLWHGNHEDWSSPPLRVRIVVP